MFDNLQTASQAATRLGKYAQAERLARQALAIPTNFTDIASDPTDPRIYNSRTRGVLARAIAMQGRNAEAQEILQPALTYYASEQKAGADGTTFRHDYAYALYVSAIAAPKDAASAKQRKADLDAAARLIAGASTQARQLSQFRYLSGLIAAARSGSHG